MRDPLDRLSEDLPVVFERLSLMTLSNSDGAFLVTTAELPSLHLARKAIRLLDQLGFPKDRFQILVNRTDKRSDIGNAELEKLFGCKVHSRVPNDFASVNRAISRGEPLDSKCEAGKAIAGLASRLSGNVPEHSLKSGDRERRGALAPV